MSRNFHLTNRELPSIFCSTSRSVAYKLRIHNENPDVWKCFEFPRTPSSTLLVIARALLVEGEALYSKFVLDELRSETSMLNGSGLSIPDHLIAEVEADADGTLRGMEAITNFQDTIGDLFPERGFVTSEEYDEAKDALQQCKGQIIDMFAATEAEHAAWEESWPFDS